MCFRVTKTSGRGLPPDPRSPSARHKEAVRNVPVSGDPGRRVGQRPRRPPSGCQHGMRTGKVIGWQPTDSTQRLARKERGRVNGTLTSLNDFLRSDRLFEIPIYQRGYAWEKENLRDLWDDLTYLEQHPQADRDDDRKHILRHRSSEEDGKEDEGRSADLRALRGDRRPATADDDYCPASRADLPVPRSRRRRSERSGVQTRRGLHRLPGQLQAHYRQRRQVVLPRLDPGPTVCRRSPDPGPNAAARRANLLPRPVPSATRKRARSVPRIPDRLQGLDGPAGDHALHRAVERRGGPHVRDGERPRAAADQSGEDEEHPDVRLVPRR